VHKEHRHSILLLGEEGCEVDVDGDITWRTISIGSWYRCFEIWKRVDELLSLFPIADNVINIYSRNALILYY